MKKHLKKILSFCVALSIVLTTIINSFATENISINLVETPNIDIVLAAKETSLDLSNFEKDVKTALINKNINTDNINFVTAKTSQLDTTSSDAQKMFSTWTEFPFNLKYNWYYDASTKSVKCPSDSVDDTGFMSKDEYSDFTMSAVINPTELNQVEGLLFRMKQHKDNPDLYDGYFLWCSGDRYSDNGVLYRTIAILKVENANLNQLTRRGGVSNESNGYPATVNQIVTTSRSDGYYYGPTPQHTVVRNGVRYWSNHMAAYPTWWKVEAGSSTTGAVDKNMKITQIGDLYASYFGNYGDNAYGGIIPVDTTPYTLSIEAKNNHFTVKRNGETIIDTYDVWGTPIYSGSVGFFTQSEPNVSFSNIDVSYTTYKTYKEILTQPTWREDAKHIVVNVDNNTDNTLTSTSTIGEILSRTLADDIHFIQWGTDTNKSATTNFIKQNDNKGLFTYNNNYEQALKDTVEYIKSLINQQEFEEQIITIGQEINLLVTPEKYKINAISDDYPNGRWKINHDYKYYSNNLGQSEDADFYTKNLNCKFYKPGKYQILFDDEIIKTIYVHRKPVADFEISFNNTNLTLTSTSYDLDSNLNNGISSERWYYKETSTSNWTEGKLTELDKTKIYVIKLEVTDYQGITNYTTKYVGTGNPLANFNFANNTICKYNKLEINNTSYDPMGYDIKSENWELKKDGQVIGTYSEPILDFNKTNLGSGNYSYTLTITNSNGTKSEAYTKSFTVVEDIGKPEIIVDAEVSNNWVTETNVDIELTDNESSVSKWRYEFVTSPIPTNDEWSSWNTEETKVNINSGALSGRYYLHIQAYDEANNLTERTIGPFNLDNSNPVINNVNIEKQNIRNTKVTIDALDEHSGIVGYAITKAEPIVYSRLRIVQIIPEFQESNEFTVTEDGLYTVWVQDELGNIETTTINITNSDKIDKGTKVYAEIGSTFKVIIPKKITLDGTAKSGNYQVSVEGDIAGLETITVEPDSIVKLNSKNKTSVNGTIVQDKINWTYLQITTENKVLANGSITAKDITAGTWNGTFNFNIKLENNFKYNNSEWNVEYETYEFK